jgi:hypothetical protein
MRHNKTPKIFRDSPYFQRFLLMQGRRRLASGSRTGLPQPAERFYGWANKANGFSVRCLKDYGWLAFAFAVDGSK